MRDPETERGRRSPWVLGIWVFLGLVVLSNAAFIYVAVTGADPVAPSYTLIER